VTYQDNAAPPKGQKFRIDVDNRIPIDGYAKVEGDMVFGDAHVIFLSQAIEPMALLMLMQAQTALKVTLANGRQLRFLAYGARDAIRALHDAC
jgi:hypothetical protein